jgi:hypothetical protein
MIIFLIIMGFIIGIYLMEIVYGHLVTKRIMAALKKMNLPDRGEETTTTVTNFRSFG